MITKDMDTFFALAERDSSEEIKQEVERVSRNPVINGVLKVVGGLLAVLNEKRQILAVNENLLTLLGIEDPENVLGLRPGEALHCTHSSDMPAGCGTSKFCASCGAAIAMVVSLSQGQPEERICVMETVQNGYPVEFCFQVRSQPIVFDEQQLLLIFLQDISEQQQKAALERVFYHDMSNILTGLIGTSQLLATRIQTDEPQLASTVNELTTRLMQEIRIQQALKNLDAASYQPTLKEVYIQDIYSALQKIFQYHHAAEDKDILFEDVNTLQKFHLDECVLNRILVNMITNAVEATSPSGEVKVWAEQEGDNLTFFVWNKDEIPADVKPRVFQRNFSTKGGLGRGLGTYSMKLFGEEILCGKVGFHSSEEEGTTFYLELPL